MNRHLFKVLLIGCVISFSAVDNLKAQSFSWEEFISRMATDEETYGAWSYLYDDLCEIHDNPININSASTEELAQLPFLTREQIESIQAYIYLHGPMQSLGELNLIRELTFESRQLLSLFVYCGKKEEGRKFPSIKNIAKYGQHEMVWRTDVPLYKRAAYQHYPDSVLIKSPNKVYQGSPLYHSLRYNFHYGQKIQAGVVMEKDAGEPFFSGVNKGFDNYSYYLLINNIGVLKTLTLGNYRLHFGQGLVMNTNFSLGKWAVLSQFENLNKGIKKHSSTSESNYFEGAAAAVQLGRFTATAFYSYKHIDATLDKDMLITSFKTDGYHRTLLEISKKNNTVNQLMGCNLTWSSKGFHLGLTTAYTLFNRVLKPAGSAYKQYYPYGNRFGNVSVDYAYYHPRFSLMGETAISDSGAIATVNAIRYKASNRLMLTAVYRYYATNYNAIYANSFSEGGDVKNEQGVYIGAVWTPQARWKITSYIDFFRFPWLKYQVSLPHSKGMEVRGQVQYTPHDKLSFLLKYKCKVRQKDFKVEDSDVKVLANNVSQSLRLQGDYQLGDEWVMRTNVDASQINVADGAPDVGYAFSQQFTYKPQSAWMQASLSGVYFHTDSYDSRVYGYEKGLLYSFSFPSYYYHGFRLSALFRFDIGKHWMLIAKYGHTKYFNKPTISSAQDLIDRSVKQDISFQLRMKF